jgi:hypothetical protein
MDVECDADVEICLVGETGVVSRVSSGDVSPILRWSCVFTSVSFSETVAENFRGFG